MSSDTTYKMPMPLSAKLLYLLSLGMTLFYFSLLLAAMTSTKPPDANTNTALVILTLAAIVSLWFLYKCLREIMDLIKEGLISCKSTLRLLWSAFPALRVPFGIFILGVCCRKENVDPTAGWIIGALIAAILPHVFAWLCAQTPAVVVDVLAGTRLISHQEACKKALALRREGEIVLLWSLELPERYGEAHFLALGGTGEGKSVLLLILLKGVVPHVVPGNDWRILIYDTKGNIIPFLKRLSLNCKYYDMNPLHRDSYAWDMAADINTPMGALQLARILIPHQKNDNVFFTYAARGLLAAVVKALILTRPACWSLSDVIVTLSDKKRTKCLLNSTRHTRRAVKRYLTGHQRTIDDVFRTITVHLEMLEPIVALWSHTSQKISLEHWVRDESILVLGVQEDHREPLNVMNRLICQRFVEIILSQPDSDTRRTWFFCDEAQDAGELDSMPRAFAKGRSKGFRGVLSGQTIEDFRATYPNGKADALLGLCRNKALFASGTPQTRRWCSDVIGEARYREWLESIKESQRTEVTRTEHREKRDAVLPSEFGNLPPAEDGQFQAYFVTPGIGTYKAHVDFASVLGPPIPEHIYPSRPVSEQYLDDTDDEEPASSRSHTLHDIKRVGRNKSKTASKE